MAKTRIERDTMGEVAVPAARLWGAQTQRSLEHFDFPGETMPVAVIRALARVKRAAARANGRLGLLAPEKAAAIAEAAGEILDGRHDGEFPLAVWQTGSGTQSNMNLNEVLANRASQLLGGGVGRRRRVHPNDEVNLGQSSNDVFPTAMHVAAVLAVEDDLLPALAVLAATLRRQARRFAAIVKIGRTHLQDATPIRLGQEFSGYAAQARLGAMRCQKAIRALRELPIGGTAVGTGINTPKGFGAAVAERLASKTGIDFVEAANHFEAQHAKDGFVEASGLLKTVAISLGKIANDIRFLGSGPRCGIGELKLPATQPGSSIMPGKVNPVMCEMLMQACSHAIGSDAAVTHAAATLGNFDLHVGMPVMAHNFLEATRILSNAVRVFTDRCIAGLEADQQRAEQLVEQSLAMCTSLAPVIGYDNAAALAKKAYETGKTVRQVALEQNVLPADQLNKLLDPRAMTEPGASAGPAGG